MGPLDGTGNGGVEKGVPCQIRTGTGTRPVSSMFVCFGRLSHLMILHFLIMSNYVMD